MTQEQTFANIPYQLRESLGTIPPELRDPKFRYAAAAGLVVKQYLGKALAQQQTGPLLRLDAAAWQFSARVTQIGANLFHLREEPGFREMCRRLRENGRDAVSTHCELGSAMKMKQRGFQIHARRETQVRGGDFDFWATSEATRVNCEVTFFRGAEFTRSNVLNTLRKKRTQVPTGAPAIIDCYWPAERWSDPPERLERELFAISQEFFRGTGRINYVLFSREMFIPRPGGGALLISSQTCWNENPREHSPALDAAMRRYPENHAEVSQLLAADKNFTGGFGKFVEWVDSVLGPVARDV